MPLFGANKSTKKYWSKWAKKQIVTGVPRQEVWDQLMKTELSMGTSQIRSRLDIATEVMNVMLDRNLRGTELERDGQVEKAIALYEANLSDGFTGKHPYERLRVIYSKRKDYQNAIRACKAYLRLATPTDKKREAFEKHLAKLEGKL